MPFTPFHFPPSLTVSLPLRRYIDIPSFVLANVAVDLEPLSVMTFKLKYNYHGYCHTLLGGIIVGLICGFLAYRTRGTLGRLMDLLKIPYEADLKKMLVSGVLGVWFHVMLDSIIHLDVKPFYPAQYNPLYSIMGHDALYAACAAMLVPAVWLYIRARKA
ncbi:MAG: hydrolase [Nitrospirae bacterium]|nr:MAG: hydrolase [Nitrospirota bacterium]